ncbi:uncharacterized protein LOC125854344 [Solanum stenotomum]|uniref:uncharacterized protein LOC125854344 n=1 Tax=Solanum stenotomum TaxID=172797 RepID=UPI0020D1DED5|nr:uncharacterized protein LOC125854344 [Solanum stenotomum]
MSHEDISEWQQIPYSSSSTTTNNNNNNIQIAFDEMTILPLIEDITIDNNNSNDDDEKGEYGNKWLKKSLRELSCWIVQVASKMRNYASSKVGIGKFTYNGSRILTFLLVPLFYWMIKKKWRRQRQIDNTSNKLMLLVQEKDQKIEQLSLQISQMNESLLTRRKVPVLQVG